MSAKAYKKRQRYPEGRRGKLIKVYEDTKNIARTLHPEASPALSTLYTLDEVLEQELPTDLPFGEENRASIKIYNRDTLVAAEELVSSGYRPLVLNFASKWKAGGGVTGGAMAQEEELFRRSSYPLCCNHTFYPMADEKFNITKVLVMKDTNYNLMDSKTRFHADFIALAALKNPQTNKLGHLSGKNYTITHQKIECLFRYAAINGYDSVVFGALGCGAYRNPPETISDIFLEMQTKYSKYFRTIVYAILSRGTDNLDIFKAKLRVRKGEGEEEKEALEDGVDADGRPVPPVPLESMGKSARKRWRKKIAEWNEEQIKKTV
jgi:uncharacterized protein (TIGR02452 family)